MNVFKRVGNHLKSTGLYYWHMLTGFINMGAIGIGNFIYAIIGLLFIACTLPFSIVTDLTAGWFMKHPLEKHGENKCPN